MKKYDIRYSLGYDRSHSWRYQVRIEAINEEEAKQYVIDQCKKERPNEKVMNIKVNEAQDFIAWTYNSHKQEDGTYCFKKEYYGGYVDLNMFGKAPIYYSEQNKAKKFQLECELKNEIKLLGRKIMDYKIEKTKVE